MDRQIGLSYTASITINISYRISGLQAERERWLAIPVKLLSVHPHYHIKFGQRFLCRRVTLQTLIESYDQNSCT